MINELAKEIFKNNIEKGFYEDKKNIGEMLCLIHSEVSEALECDRKDKFALTSEFDSVFDKNIADKDVDPFVIAFTKCIKDTFEDELADIMIRVMDLAAYKGIDLEWHIKYKMRYNLTRPHKHGKKY